MPASGRPDSIGRWPACSGTPALTLGQPGFFVPWQLHDWFSSNKRISYYDTSALKRTLERLVDFDRINKANDIRLSVGAVNVGTGQFSYFDSRTHGNPRRTRHGQWRAAPGISIH